MLNFAANRAALTFALLGKIGMTKNIKFFLIVILVSLPFWWLINVFQMNLEDILLAKEIEEYPAVFYIAQISQKYPTLKEIEISAQAAISIEIDEKGKEKVIFKKNENERMAIASLTKLMTGIVALEFYQPWDMIEISKAAVDQPEKTGQLRVGEVLRVEDLLRIMLIESSNDAAFALTQPVKKVEAFVDLMNLKAKEMGLEDTYFFNPTGLDPEEDPSVKKSNYSTARDLAKLTKYLLENHPLILGILNQKEYQLYLKNGLFHHNLQNTNELLGETPGIIGGKTGFTEKAGGCLVLISRAKKEGNYLINVILNSAKKFEDMRKLID